MIQLNTSPLASMNQRQRNYPIWAHHHTSLIIFSFSSSPTSNGSVFHSSNLKVWLLLNTQSSSLTISTSHFLERSQSKLHPLPWDTTLIYPTVGEVLPLQRMRWPWPTCDGPITLEQEWTQECGWMRARRFPLLETQLRPLPLLTSEGHHLYPSYNSLQAMIGWEQISLQRCTTEALRSKISIWQRR